MQTSRSGAARRPLVIANPRAGRGRAGRGFAHLVRAIRASVGDVDVAETRRPGHATGLAVVSPESEESYSDESKELAPHWSTPL